MAVDVEKLKEYLRLPPDSGDDLETFLNAAKSKAKAAGIPDYKNNAQYDLFILALATMYYDNRGLAAGSPERVTFEGSMTNYMLNSFILELRYAGEDS